MLAPCESIRSSRETEVEREGVMSAGRVWSANTRSKRVRCEEGVEGVEGICGRMAGEDMEEVYEGRL